MPRRRRRRELRATIGEVADWNPKPIPPKPAPIPFTPARETRSILSALEAVPRLTADIGLATAARSDAHVEILPGEPTMIAFSAGGQLPLNYFLHLIKGRRPVEVME